MSDIVIALVNRDHPVDEEMWRSFWDRLHDGKLRRGEATALLSSLSTRMPDRITLRALLTSLDERRTPPATRHDSTVNIVGTGGGPKTFNISTAAALVAAAMGVRVIKTGSHAYSSRHGSFDLLERLRIPLARSYGQVDDMLERFGIAFAGYFVYPAELALLAKSILPFDLRALGRFFNSVGPFLAAVPVSAQVTGVSDRALLPTLWRLATRDYSKKIWLCTNSLGADELISITENVIYPNRGMDPIRLSPGALRLGAGTMTNLAPVAEDSALVNHFLALLSGDGSPVAVQTICLNAAALAVVGGMTDNWMTALRLAGETIKHGLAAHLVERLRTEGTRSLDGLLREVSANG
ncbi:MAG: anthranilate phosphoribosyltransferase [Actinomycetota bacterium]